MAFPKRGYHCFSDTISTKMWGINRLSTLAGSGSMALASNPSGVRGNVLRFRSPDGNTDSAYYQTQIVHLDHDQAANTTNAAALTTDQYVRLRFYVSIGSAPADGSAFDLLMLRDTTPSAAYNVEVVYQSSTGKFVLRPSSSVGSGFSNSRALDFDTWTDLVIGFHSGGTFEMQTRQDGEGSYTTESIGSVTASATTINAMRIGCSNLGWGAGSFDVSVYVDDFCTTTESLTEAREQHYLYGSGIRDITNTASAPVLMIPANLFAAVTHARFTYSTDSGFTSPSSGSWVAISGAANSALGLGPITGLSAGTQYYGRFELATSASAGAIVHTSDTYKFRTLPAAGTDQAMLMAFASCHTGRAPSHPYEDEQWLIDYVNASSKAYVGCWHVGDQGYEASSQVSADDDYGWPGGETAAETQDDYQQIFREFLCDIVHERLRKLGPVIYQPDDHEFINDGDARHAPGGSMASDLANSYTGEQTSNSYGASTTLSTLWTAGLTAHANMFTDHWISPAASGKRYQAKVFGRLHVIQIDTRLQRNPSTPTYINNDSAQKAWLKARLDDFATDANANTCLILAQDGWAQFTTKPTEGWERIAGTEFAEIINYIYDSAGTSGVPVTKNVLLLSGDDHIGYCHHTDIETATHPTMALPLVGELRVSGASASFMDVSSEYAAQPSKVLWSMAKGTLSASDALRTSGALLEFTDTARTMTAHAWVNSA